MFGKAIWFDMDGTLYDLYKIPGWLAALQNEDWSIYNQPGYCRANLNRIRNAIHALAEMGWTVGVITWAAKDVYDEETLAAIEEEKVKWLRENIPELDRMACLPYGYDKAQFIEEMEEVYAVNYLVDDNALVRKEWRKHGEGFHTINASRAFYRYLEGLVG